MVVLALLALTLLAHGALHLARQQLEAARVSALELQGRLAAEGGVRLVGSETVRAGLPADRSAAVVAGSLGARSDYRVRVRALGPELTLLHGTGRVEGWPGRPRVLRLLWTPDPSIRLATFRSVVEAGAGVSVSSDGRIVASDPLEGPQGWEALCDSLEPLLLEAFPWDGLDRAGPLGTAGDSAGSDLGALGLGPLTFEILAGRADTTLEGATRLPPPTDPCLVGSFPSARAGELEAGCDESFPVMVGRGPLVLTGGEARGVLVVEGDLSLAGDAAFTGLVLATGDATVADDARVRGLVRGLKTVSVQGRGRIEGSLCVAFRALTRAPGVSSAGSLPGGSWLEGF